MEAAPADHDAGVYDLVRTLITANPGPTARELEMAAQLLYDSLGEQAFCQRLSAILAETKLSATMAQRLKHLRSIPFRAIVTANFDPLLPGLPPAAEVCRRLRLLPTPRGHGGGALSGT